MPACQSASACLHLFYFNLLPLLLCFFFSFDLHLKWAVPCYVSHWSCISLARSGSLRRWLPGGCRAIERSSARSYPCSAVGSRAEQQQHAVWPGVFVDCGEFLFSGVLSLSTLRRRQRQVGKKESQATLLLFFFSVAAAALFYMRMCLYIFSCMCMCYECTYLCTTLATNRTVETVVALLILLCN